jgi:hypothetical protein
MPTSASLILLSRPPTQCYTGRRLRAMIRGQLRCRISPRQETDNLGIYVVVDDRVGKSSDCQKPNAPSLNATRVRPMFSARKKDNNCPSIKYATLSLICLFYFVLYIKMFIDEAAYAEYCTLFLYAHSS